MYCNRAFGRCKKVYKNEKNHKAGHLNWNVDIHNNLIYNCNIRRTSHIHFLLTVSGYASSEKYADVYCITNDNISNFVLPYYRLSLSCDMPEENS